MFDDETYDDLSRDDGMSAKEMRQELEEQHAEGQHTEPVEACWSCEQDAEGINLASEYNLPATTLDGITLYITRGIAPGHFLTAVIENDLLASIKYADTANLEALSRIVSFFYDQAPYNCWGSRNKMSQWIKRFEEN